MKPMINGMRVLRNIQSNQKAKTSPSMKTRSLQCALITMLTELKSNLDGRNLHRRMYNPCSGDFKF
jgi:hypothetical protein